MADPRLSGGNGLLFYRWRPAANPADPAVVLLHGRTGDESVMWIVADALPSMGLMIAPRGPFSVSEGGFSWVGPIAREKGTFEDLRSGVTALETLLDRLEVERGLDRDQMVLVGFSQGAALAFAPPKAERLRPRGIVALAGFLPRGDPAHLRGIPIFWGHGTQDTLVPIGMARSDVERLHEVDDSVQFCEADVGHRIGVDCMRGLNQWWLSHFSRRESIETGD